MNLEFVELPATERRGAVTLEYQWINQVAVDTLLFVFLHEGLGSVAMWKDWPQLLCDELGVRGLIYSRPGYGRSTPRPPDEHWPVGYLADQARDILPAFLDAVCLRDAERTRMWLVGHSDGASIALHYAAAFPGKLAGAVVIAPHVFVEQESVDAIRETLAAYLKTDLRRRLAAYHDNVDSAFFGWNQIWLDPAFRSWDMSGELGRIQRPLLAIQANDDGYATMAHIDIICQCVPHAQAERMDHGGHSPFRQKPKEVNAAIAAFVRGAASYRRT